jgi:hypothetical protein
MRISRYWVLVLGLVGGMLFSSKARAGGVAVESVAGERAKATAAVLAPIFEELGKRGYGSGYASVGKGFEKSSRASRVQGGLPSDFVERVDRAYRLWITGKFPEGLAALRPLVAEAHQNPASVIANPAFGNAVFKAHVGIAMCHHRLGDDTAAWAAMAELLRSFDTEVSKGQYGAEAFALYQQVKKEARAKATGGLTVRAADSTAAIYVNERFAKVGEVSRADLVPGTYRVVAQLGPEFGRAYDVEVKAGARAELVVDPAFERAVVTSEAWTGFAFRDRSEREQREGEVATRFATALGELGVIVVGVDVYKERAVAYGALFNASSGKEIRRASVVIDTVPPPARLQALARFLVGDPTPLDGVEVHKLVARPRPQPGGATLVVAEAPPPSTFTRRRKLALGLGGLGVAGLAAGALMTVQAYGFQSDAEDLCTKGVPCEDQPAAQRLTDRAEARSRLSFIGYGLGAAALIGAGYLWFTGAPSDEENRASIAPQLAPGYAGLDLIGRF